MSGTKPILAVDVDGVISLFGFEETPDRSVAKFELIDGVVHCISVVAGDRLLRLSESFELVWLRPPTEEELQGLIEDRVREEIFYREARALGLDRDDPVVRDRLRELALDELGEDSQTILARYTVLVESGETRSR